MQFHTVPGEGDLIDRLNELVASSEPFSAAKGQFLLKLVEYLQSRGPTPDAGAMLLDSVLTITLFHPTRSVDIWIDWQDRGQTKNGMPTFHYRLQIRTPDTTLSEDFRVPTHEEAAIVILTA